MPCLKAVTPHHIVQAEEADLEAILELQRLAYQGEARLLNDFSIPPLMQTLEEMKEEFRSGIFLKAVDEKGKIVGSVRGTLRGDTLLIGKLMVHPEYQGNGLGSCLLQELEKNCPAPRLELFTSNKSLRNLCLYERNGYTRCVEKAVSPALTLIFLEEIKDREEKVRCAQVVGDKYSTISSEEYANRAADKIRVFRLNIEHISGKRLVKAGEPGMGYKKG